MTDTKQARFRLSELESMLGAAQIKYSRDLSEKSGAAKENVRYTIDDDRYLDTQILMFHPDLKGWSPEDKGAKYINPKELGFTAFYVVKYVDFASEFDGLAKGIMAVHRERTVDGVSFNDPSLKPYLGNHDYLAVHIDTPVEVVNAASNINVVANILKNAVEEEKKKFLGIYEKASKRCE